ncbi:type IV secretion system protein [Vibrio alginolyticus]|uniref:type IV secretion system protein n=1 Tax=Vibrio alginolyticus TaxID=663 RepID=UPI001EEDA262|nr:type IV secretion system protein [Vibrio alginolyticus]EIE5872995.1 type IV secretion protein [Vibrio parahaemolyticus]EJT4224708.1 type IV secretion protein [Vibrio parahaemolyticus]MCR9514088.1 type IV secretion system protein [Vibrio alginolyticus]ULF72071.1 type IV secretion system protein [Vibrio alginolyticus]HCE2641736.1 type IV secretion protein [Vibrio parahaemolyticus]
MKKPLLAAAIALTIGVSQPSFAGGIPVIDVAGIVEAVKQFQVLQTQLKTLDSQLNTAKNNLNSIKGVRNMASVINSAYDTAIDVDPQSILSSTGLKNASDLTRVTGTGADLLNSGNLETANWLAQSQKSLEQSKARFAELSGLVAKVNAAPDQKDILDLQARIGAEEVMLQNEMAKLTMLRSQAEANQAIHAQKVKQASIQSSGQLRTVSW